MPNVTRFHIFISNFQTYPSPFKDQCMQTTDTKREGEIGAACFSLRRSAADSVRVIHAPLGQTSTQPTSAQNTRPSKTIPDSATQNHTCMCM